MQCDCGACCVARVSGDNVVGMGPHGKRCNVVAVHVVRLGYPETPSGSSCDNKALVCYKHGAAYVAPCRPGR